MKILTNWATTGRAAVAAMMLTASAAGVTSCFNNTTNSKNSVGDVFVKEKVADLVYKDNDVMVKRHIYSISPDADTKRYQELYDAKYGDVFKERGLYGGSIYQQRKYDFLRYQFPWHLKYSYQEKCDAMSENGMYITRDEIKARINEPEVRNYDHLRHAYFNFWNDTYASQGGHYFEQYLQKLDDDLFMDSEPTWQQCSKYLDREIAGLDFLSQQDYEKCMDDIAKFQKHQKRHDDIGVAEMLAYKEFKLDSLVLYNRAKEYGLLDTPEYRRFYRDYCNKGRLHHDMLPPEIGE